MLPRMPIVWLRSHSFLIPVSLLPTVWNACVLSSKNTEHHVFSPAMIDGIIAQLRAFDDVTLRKNIEGYPEEIKKLVTKYFHCG